MKKNKMLYRIVAAVIACAVVALALGTYQSRSSNERCGHQISGSTGYYGQRCGRIYRGFELFGCKQRMLEHGNRDDVPVTLGTALGLLWGAAFEKEEGKLKRVWVIGPVFHRDVTMRGIEEGLKYYSKLEISVAWTIQLYKALEKVPTLQNTIMNRYLLMMHYCLTGQRLELSDVNSSAAQDERLKSDAIPHDRHQCYLSL